jgi:hypothetical protein
MSNIRLHKAQSVIFKDMFIDRINRFGVAICARGFGKSYLAATAGINAIFELLELHPLVPNKNVYIIAPTYDQVTDIYYPLINYDLGMEEHALRSSKDTGRFIFPNNVELRLVSYEAIERMRGKGAYFVVCDEPSSWTKGVGLKEAWEGIIQPTIITRWSPKRAKIYGAKSPGRGLIIGTPKGYNFLYDMYNYQETDKLWKSYHYDYHHSPFLDADEIERIKHTIDPIEFASEYMATFEDSGVNVFYCFDRKKHVTDTLPDFIPPDGEEKGETVYFNIDFNVGKQCTSAMAIRGGQVHILDEFQGHPDTEQLAIALTTKYRGHKMVAFPDPSGKSRKTSAPVGRTDFSILESHGITVLAHLKAPPIIDSVAAVNKKLLTAAGDVDMYVHPRCKGVIKSLERTKWVDKNQDTATIDKSDDIEHFSDGIRYGIEYLFPVRQGTKRVTRGFGF